MKTRIASIEPTLFFKKDEKGLRQLVKVALKGKHEAKRFELLVEGAGIEEKLTLHKSGADALARECMFPDIREPAKLRLSLQADGVVSHRTSFDWKPERHWEVSLIHMSHHDWGYTGIPSDVVEEHIEFMDRVLDWCDETAKWPEESRFRYLCEQAWSVIPWIENRPKSAIDRFVRCVKRGQIEVGALWGNQTSELCGHEELVRLMYPSFRLKRELGIDIVSAIHNDIPGFSWGLVSAMAGAGLKYFNIGMPRWYFGFGEQGVHPCWGEQDFIATDVPGPFFWEGPDGSRVFTFYLFHGARSLPEPWLTVEQDLPAELKRLEQDGYAYEQVAHMVTGGHRDNAPPTMYIARLAKKWNTKWEYPKILTATNEQFMGRFAELHGDKLKTFRGELPNTDYTVCATCTPKETAVNRNAHDALVTAEKLATIARRVSKYKYPRDVIDNAYRNTFNYDLHCWGMYLCGGPAMDASWDEKRGAATRAAALAHDVIVKAGNRITDQVKYRKKGFYLTVFNQLSWQRDEIVRMPAADWCPSTTPMTQPERGTVYTGVDAIGRGTFSLDAALIEESFELVDESTGESVPFQISMVKDASDPRPWSAERLAMSRVWTRPGVEFVFLAKNLPAMGYKTYRVVPKPGEELQPSNIDESAGPVENRFFKLKLNEKTGVVASLYDKELGVELVDDKAAHGFGDLVVRTCETADEMGRITTDMRIVERGPVCTVIRVKGSSFGVPKWTRDIVLYDDLKRVDINARLLRDSEPNLELYFAFPFNVDKPGFRFEGGGSVIEPTHDQIPGSGTDYYAIQHWADISNDKHGVTWTPLDTHMAEFGGLWPGYVSAAHHGVTGPGYGHPFLKPGEMKKSHIYAMVMYSNFKTNFINVQPGEIMCRYSFGSHRGDWSDGRARKFGWSVSNPPFGVWMQGPQKGSLPPEQSFCDVSADNVIVLTVKPAENGKGLVVRCMETEGKKTKARLSLAGVRIRKATETNLVEENLGPAAGDKNSVEISFKPYEMKTVRIT